MKPISKSKNKGLHKLAKKKPALAKKLLAATICVPLNLKIVNAK